jgi:hypothetical protein
VVVVRPLAAVHLEQKHAQGVADVVRCVAASLAASLAWPPRQRGCLLSDVPCVLLAKQLVALDTQNRASTELLTDDANVLSSTFTHVLFSYSRLRMFFFLTALTLRVFNRPSWLAFSFLSTAAQAHHPRLPIVCSASGVRIIR